jgi:hypothetical protein
VDFAEKKKVIIKEKILDFAEFEKRYLINRN